MRPKGSRVLRGTINHEEVKMLREAMCSANLEKCGCSEEAKHEMRQYLKSWVVRPIRSVLDNLEKRHREKIHREANRNT